MIAALDKHNRVFLDQIHQTVFFGDTTRPAPGKIMFKRFRFADSFKGLAHDVLDEGVYAFEYFLVGALPVLILVPGFQRKANPHRIVGLPGSFQLHGLVGLLQSRLTGVPDWLRSKADRLFPSRCGSPATAVESGHTHV